MCHHIKARAAAGNKRPIVLCPVGFITDHIEVQWDLDTEAADLAAKNGVPFVRVATPGLSASFASMIVDLLQDAIATHPNLPAGSEMSTGAALGAGADTDAENSAELTSPQVKAKSVIEKFGTVPNFGCTLNGSPCAPGCCGAAC